MNLKWANFFSLALVAVSAALLGWKNFDWHEGHSQLHLLNVSYDPTRELYAQINHQFVEKFRKENGRELLVEQSHGGSSRQARAVGEGLAADVVTLALPSDIDLLRQRGLVAGSWREQFPNHAQPYYSTIVFVVRKGNPKQIHDWPDLITQGVEVVVPNPKTSGNGKLAVLAAWGSVLQRGGTENEAREFLADLYHHVSILGQGARDATTAFTLGNEGDVHLTWENEALREVAESSGILQIIRPSTSIRAEPSVAVVETNVAKHKTTDVARAYLSYLFTDEAQETLAQNGYRPIKEDIAAKHRDRLPEVSLFPITLVARDWEDAEVKFFSDNGIFDAIHPPTTK